MYNTVGKNGRGFADFYDHFDGRESGSNILGVWGADGDWYTTHIQTSIKRCDQIHPLKKHTNNQRYNIHDFL